jgi:hypothetical protein
LWGGMGPDERLQTGLFIVQEFPFFVLDL